MLSRLSSKAPSPSCLFFLLFPHSNSRMQERNSLCFSAFFFYCLSLAFFLSFFSYPLSRSLFFSYFSAPFFCYFSALFLPPFARSLKGFIYSLTYLYLGKIQCINSRMQIPADVQKKNAKRKLKYSYSYSDFQHLISIDQRVVQLLSFLP